MTSPAARFATVRACLLAAGSACLLAAPLSTSWAAGPGAKSGSLEARYRAERAACESGRSHQDKATCLLEARNAYADARRGRLHNGATEQQLAENRLLRCRAQPVQERAECERLARGEGTTSGSVEGGGVIRELVTRVEGTPSTN